MAILFGGAVQSGGDLVLGGGGARAQVLDSPALSGTKGLEVDFWFLDDPAQPAYADILSEGHGAASGDTGWNVEFEGSTGLLGFGVYLTVTPPASPRVLSLRPVNDGRWHRLRGIYDPSLPVWSCC